MADRRVLANAATVAAAVSRVMPAPAHHVAQQHAGDQAVATRMLLVDHGRRCLLIDHLRRGLLLLRQIDLRGLLVGDPPRGALTTTPAHHRRHPSLPAPSPPKQFSTLLHPLPFHSPLY